MKRYICLVSIFALGAWAYAPLVSATTVDVSITSTGYVPQIVTIAPGDTVRWTNNDLTTPTRGVNSDPHNTHSDYPSLDFDDIPQGDSVTLSFPGSCVRHGYHDHEKEEDEGAIIVTGSCGTREPDKPVFWGVFVTRMSPTSALIEWSTERGSYTQVAYGTKKGGEDQSSTIDGVLTKFHRAEITGLTASTTYYYHAVGGMGLDQKFPSDEYTFTTLDFPHDVTPAPASDAPATTTWITPPASSTPESMMMDMPGMTHKHTGMGVSAYAIRTVRSQKFQHNLTFGQRGNDVKALQAWLVERSLLSKRFETGYFGGQTKRAVIAYQKSMTLPMTGYFGPMTRSMIDAMGE